MSNCLKAAEDILTQAGVILDDNQITQHRTYRGMSAVPIIEIVLTPNEDVWRLNPIPQREVTRRRQRMVKATKSRN